MTQMLSAAAHEHGFVRFAAMTALFLCINGRIAFSDGLQTASRDAPGTRLEMVRALPVQRVRDPSGLTIHNGILYSVSDKVDDMIWRVELGKEQAVFREHMTFECEELAGKRLDLEGISIDSSGQFYVLSETQFAVIRVGPNGKASIVKSFEDEGKRAGLFSKLGAGPEGLAWQEHQRFLVSAEREPAGLIEINGERSPRITVFGASAELPLRAGRPADITGIFIFPGDIWCLSRNAECIFRMELMERQHWKRREVLSFAHVVNKPEFAYQDMRFGHAEGLAVDERFFYVILDNNDVPRAAHSNDRRPLLFIFKRRDDHR